MQKKSTMRKVNACEPELPSRFTLNVPKEWCGLLTESFPIPIKDLEPFQSANHVIPVSDPPQAFLVQLLFGTYAASNLESFVAQSLGQTKYSLWAGLKRRIEDAYVATQRFTALDAHWVRLCQLRANLPPGTLQRWQQDYALHEPQLKWRGLRGPAYTIAIEYMRSVRQRFMLFFNDPEQNGIENEMARVSKSDQKWPVPRLPRGHQDDSLRSVLFRWGQGGNLVPLDDLASGATAFVAFAPKNWSLDESIYYESRYDLDDLLKRMFARLVMPWPLESTDSPSSSNGISQPRLFSYHDLVELSSDGNFKNLAPTPRTWERYMPLGKKYTLIELQTLLADLESRKTKRPTRGLQWLRKAVEAARDFPANPAKSPQSPTNR